MNYQINKKYKIIIPKNTIILYHSEKNIITILGPINKKSLKLNLKIKIFKNYNAIFVTNIPTNSLINTKRIKALQGTLTAKLKTLLTESSAIVHKTLKFNGIGYKSFNVNNFNNILNFKLGFSHSIYFKTAKNLNIFCIKQTKLFIYGFSLENVSKTAAKIQSLKFPEPYKGKGILNEYTKIKLKEGKKT